MHALVAEAIRKVAIVWLAVDGAPAYPVWCLTVGDAVYLVTGPGEQPAPGLAGAVTVRVSARGDHGGRIVTWRADVTVVAPGSEAWAAVALPLAAKRLNAPGTTDELVDRWAGECTIVGLSAADDEVEARPDASAGSGAAPPRSAPGASARRDGDLAAGDRDH